MDVPYWKSLTCSFKVGDFMLGTFFFIIFCCSWCGLPRWLGGKESACPYGTHGRLGFDPWVRKILWRRKWQATPVFLPGKSRRQRSLAGYSTQGSKKSDMTERRSTSKSWFTMLCKFQIHSKVIPSYIHTYILFRFFSLIGHSKILGIVPCAIQKVLVGYLF